MVVIKSIELAKRTLTLETGRLAEQATAAVLARFGDTMVLVTVVAGGVREDLDYFPLTVEYVERLYAGGRIKGSRWVKREGRPSDEAILTARLIDRSIRPLFPKEYKNEVQVVVTLLSVDGENAPDVLSVIATSCALSISSIPWSGPIGAVRVGCVKEANNGAFEFITFPTTSELALSELDLIVSQTRQKTVMIEAGANQVSEDMVLKGIDVAFSENEKVVNLIEEFSRACEVEKKDVSRDEAFETLVSEMKRRYEDEMRKALAEERGFADFIEKIVSDYEGKVDKASITKAVQEASYTIVREGILAEKKRPDGRTTHEIREVSAEVSVLPRTHGSAIFQRGKTKTLTVVTLGSPSLEQLIESAQGEETKRYIHHYSMPPYSVGETGRIGFPSRREIGHGALAERALLPTIPPEDRFPYTIRVVSEIMSSNGSTSMAAVCGSTLSLMDAGVPILSPVSGIAMGLVTKGDEHEILSDIAGIEDFAGDMDFKIAGTEKGITAMQLDVKTAGLSKAIIEETLRRGREGRLFILEKMRQTLEEARASVSPFAPKVEVLRVPVMKIGEIIGPGGRVIRNIIAQTGSNVDVEDDGRVTITGVSDEQVQKAVEWIKGLIVEVTAGQIYEGTVKRILPFGAFVEILPGKEGMVHVSQMGSGFVQSPHDVVKVGDRVKVHVSQIDEQGRINLSLITGGVPLSKLAPSQPRPREARAHPLSMQFRREQQAKWQKRDRGRGPRRPFRKVSY